MKATEAFATLALFCLAAWPAAAAAALGAGGLFTSFGLELLIYPVLYSIWKWRYVMRHGTVVPQPHAGEHAGLAL